MILEVEILERQSADLFAPPQFEPRVERDQHLNRIADRRAVGEVAAERGRIADRRRRETLRLFRQCGKSRQQCRPGIGESHRGADPQFLGPFLDSGEFRYVTQVDERRQLAQLLRDHETNVRAARQQEGTGRRIQGIGKFVESTRRVESRIVQGGCRIGFACNGLQDFGVGFRVGFFATPARGRGVVKLAHSGFDDGPVSGAAAQISRQGT